MVLLLAQTRSQPPDQMAAVEQAPEVVFDYLAKEVMKELTPEVHHFLLKTACFPSMTAAMAERLTGLPSAGNVLKDLHRERLFTEEHRQQEPLYQFHPLFRDFLLFQGTSTFTSEEWTTIQRTAAEVLEEAGRTEDAIGLLQQAGQMDRQARLILASAHTLLTQGRAQTVEAGSDSSHQN